jgi:outer membrane protein TolC
LLTSGKLLAVFEKPDDGQLEAKNSLAALDNDAQTLASAERAAQAARAAFDETASRARLGSLPSTTQHVSEQRFLNAQLGAVRAGSLRMSDTAALFQAMGELPAGQPHVTSRE